MSLADTIGSFRVLFRCRSRMARIVVLFLPHVQPALTEGLADALRPSFLAFIFAEVFSPPMIVPREG